MEKTKTRMPWVDSLRAIAAVWIFIVHYIDAYMPALFVYWEKGQPFCGITGKLGVAVFSVLLGYFAVSGNYKNRPLSSYVVKRYLQFSIPLFIVCIPMAALLWLTGSAEIGELFKALIGESIFFVQDYPVLCPPAWCMGDFMLASVILAVLRGRKHSVPAIGAVCFLCLIFGYVWTAACLLGALVYYLNAALAAADEKLRRIVFSRPVKLILLVYFFILIRREESYLCYIIDALACAAMLLVFLNSPRLQRLLSFGPAAKLGGVSFEIFLLSDLVYIVIHAICERLLSGFMPTLPLFWLGMGLSAVAIVLCAFLLHRLLNTKIARLPYVLFDSHEV